MSGPVYLDCNATTPMEPEVADIVRHYMEVEFGNAGSNSHSFGVAAKKAVELARTQIAAVVDADPAEVIFTSGATESNNIALLGLREHARKTGKTHFVSSQIEHKAVLKPLEQLYNEGFEVTLVAPTSGGVVPAERLIDAVTDRTCAVSLMHVNNETGVIQPIHEVAERLLRPDVIFHVDAAQGFGKDLQQLRHHRIDLISASSHKVYGPKGVGALIRRRRSSNHYELRPLTFGGGQEQGLRPGTLPVPLVAGLGLAAELAFQRHAERAMGNLGFQGELMQALAPWSPMVNGANQHRVAHCVNLRLDGLDADAVMLALRNAVAVSTGSACTSTQMEPSHVLTAMGLSPNDIAESLRLSWSHLTPDPDWQAVARGLSQLS
jgi:cysteine desulfurase